VLAVEEQDLVDFSHLWVKACHDAAKALEENPRFDGRIATFEVEEHDIPPGSSS